MTEHLSPLEALITIGVAWGIFAVGMLISNWLNERKHRGN